MSFLDGIFNRAPAQQPAAPAPQPAPAQQQPAPQAPAAGQQPAQQAQQQQTSGTPVLDKLDSYAALFAPKQQPANRPPSLDDPLLAPLDPAKFKEQVATADFTSGIPADLIQKAVGGDPQAFAAAINIAARDAFAAATTLSHGLSNHAAREAALRVNNGLDGKMREVLIKGHNTSNEVLAKPAVAPVLAAVKHQIAQDFPSFTPAQVTEAAERYFLQMADELTAPSKAAAQAQARNPKTDFSTF